jgi:hypothetical protein
MPGLVPGIHVLRLLHNKQDVACAGMSGEGATTRPVALGAESEGAYFALYLSLHVT